MTIWHRPLPRESGTIRPDRQGIEARRRCETVALVSASLAWAFTGYRAIAVDAFAAAYLATNVRESLLGRAQAALASLKCCQVCPRKCKVDRLAGEMGVCRTGRYARVASVGPHFGEEDCLRGRSGSGTIFFARCNLKCVFCQNWDISQRDAGRECGPEQIADMMLGLQARGCHNINLVTPEHMVPQVIEAIAIAVQHGLEVPIVYNTSAYDSLDSLAQLDGLIDIYMPDFKLWSPPACSRYLGARDYGVCARQAIREMHRQVGDLKLAPDGIAQRGLLVRHLVMPGLMDETAEILRWLAEEISRDTFVNIMDQYRPAYRVGEMMPDNQRRFESINRAVTREEMAWAFDLARQAGLHRLA